MRFTLALAVLLAGFAAPSFSCDVTAGPGWAGRYSEGLTGGIASVGCVADKWELRAWYVGEQRIYEGRVQIAGYPAVSASRLWTFREGRLLQPILGVGLMAKGAQRCKYNGELNCNRELPLPFCFLFSAGLKFDAVSVTVFHCSNSSLDYGPEKKNLGLDGIRGEVWF
jgi:hypothetical protein